MHPPPDRQLFPRGKRGEKGLVEIRESIFVGVSERNRAEVRRPVDGLRGNLDDEPYSAIEKASRCGMSVAGLLGYMSK